jgi:tetratricopeptide (TPR) repeat protein
MLFRISIALLIVLTSCLAKEATLKGVVLLDGVDGPGVANVSISVVDGLRSFEAIEVTYKKRLQELEGTNRASALRQERDQARDAAAKAAEELAKDQPGKTSELYREAMRYFLEGDVEQAIKTLDGEKLKGMLSATRERKAQAEKAIADVTQAWTTKARFLTLQFRFDKAEQAYKAAIEASPDSFEVNLAFGNFSQRLNRHATAMQAFNRCLDLARKSGNEPRIAGTLNNLGVLHRAQNRMDEARQAYEEALKIRRELARKNPDTYLPDVAETLNNLGILHRDQNRMAESRKALEEALGIYQRFAARDPEQYRVHVARLEQLLKALPK